MCSTIRPLHVYHCFALFQRKHVCKAPTSTFQHSLELPGMVRPVSRSKGQKCARLSAPSLYATILVCFKETVYGKPQPVSFTRALNCQEWSNQFRDPRVKVCSTIRPLPLHHCFGLFQRNRVCKAPTGNFHESLELPGMIQLASRSKGQKCAPLSAPSLCTIVLVCFKGTVYGKPQPISFTRALNCQEWSNQFREPRVKSVLDYPPPPCVPLFCFVSKETCMQSPN